MKDENKLPETKLEKELDRAYINSLLSPEYDQHVPLVDESYFEHIYGIVGNAKMNRLTKFSPDEEKGQKPKERKV